MRTVPLPREHAPPRTIAYVFNVLSIPDPSVDPTGFNLDALDSGSGIDGDCETRGRDFESVSDPGHVGIDAIFGTLVPTLEMFFDVTACPGGEREGCIDALLADQIASGALLMIVEITDVDSLEYDGRSSGRALSRGSVRRRASDAGARRPPRRRGRHSPPRAELTEPFAGDIFDGRLRVELDMLSLSFVSIGFPLPLDLESVELRADLTETSFTNAQLGGSLATEALIMAGVILAPAFADVIRTIVEAVSDIDPTAADPDDLRPRERRDGARGRRRHPPLSGTGRPGGPSLGHLHSQRLY